MTIMIMFQGIYTGERIRHENYFIDSKGNEILAKDITNDSDSILMTAGTIMKKEYINRLKN